jgi:putative N6-adenine-specific DNA methylase
MLIGVPLIQIEVEEIKAPTETPGVLLSNPPYGKRTGVRGDQSFEPDDLARKFFVTFSSTLKQGFSGWSVFLFATDLGVLKLFRLKESRRTPFFNSALECRLFRFHMVVGFNRSEAAKPKDTE